jgi:L-asparaginase
VANNNGQLKIQIISTGGTIEKTYDEYDGSLENKTTQLEKRILSRLRLPNCLYEVTPILSKDSLYFDDNDRMLVSSTIESKLEEPDLGGIIVVHGTDTMVKTADFVRLKVICPKVPIIFTGAMKPMGFDDSDALQNVTESIIASRVCSPGGVYIVFHGRIFTVPFVQKNRDKGTFEVVD